MNKVELLAPAGDFDCLKAAVLAGCDAVYIGGKMFGARAFSTNFENDVIIEAINYCHLRGVKVYVTLNTLIYEKEVNKFLEYVLFLHENNVDAVIIQDLGMLDLVHQTFPNLELHASTQMHIHNLEAIKTVEKLGIKRVVLPREMKLEDVKKMKQSGIELEVFVHGSLCVAYSGQCLMSSLIGHRSGNRGSCAGSCRLKYENETEGYFLSTKDLNTLDNLDLLLDLNINSLKIEGRMKSSAYVYLVVKLYRQAIDSYYKFGKVKYNKKDLDNLMKIFNREYTKGFLFDDNIMNEYRPNNLGINIGEVITNKNNKAFIKLTEELNVNDGIRIIGKEDTGFIVTSMFVNNNKVKKALAGEIVEIKNDKILNGKVVKTYDYNLNKEINLLLREEKKIPIKIDVEIDKKIEIKMSDGENQVSIIDDFELAITNPIDKIQLSKQLTKLGDTAYKCDDITVKIKSNAFITVKALNEYRRKLVKLLNEKRLYQIEIIKSKYKRSPLDYEKCRQVNILISELKQYNNIKKYPFTAIYMNEFLYTQINDNRKILKLDRVINSHNIYDQKLLIGEIGSLSYNNIESDFSFNVTNSYTVALLHSLGVHKITMSLELSMNQIKDIISEYKNRYTSHPNLEVIIYGKEEAMILKTDLNKDYLKDKFNNRYNIVRYNNLTTIYNFKSRKFNCNEYFDIGINNVRINLLDEDNYLKYIEEIYE